MDTRRDERPKKEEERFYTFETPSKPESGWEKRRKFKTYKHQDETGENDYTWTAEADGPAERGASSKAAD